MTVHILVERRVDIVTEDYVRVGVLVFVMMMMVLLVILGISRSLLKLQNLMESRVLSIIVHPFESTSGTSPPLLLVVESEVIVSIEWSSDELVMASCGLSLHKDLIEGDIFHLRLSPHVGCEGRVTESMFLGGIEDVVEKEVFLGLNEHSLGGLLGLLQKGRGVMTRGLARERDILRILLVPRQDVVELEVVLCTPDGLVVAHVEVTLVLDELLIVHGLLGLLLATLLLLGRGLLLGRSLLLRGGLLGSLLLGRGLFWARPSS